MYSLLLLGIVACCLSLVLTPLFRNLARKLGLVDRPDSARKLHAAPIPRIGGLAIAVSYAAAFALLVVFRLPEGDIVRHALPFAARLVPAAVLIFAVGLVDDLLGLKPWQKLVGQLAAAALAFWAGVHFEGFIGFRMPFWCELPVTLLWLVLCANAFNLIDGMDGLATGVGLFATLTVLLAALLQNNFPLALTTVGLAGALLGFLRYNFNPASIFLGDCGSLSIGFLLGCYGVMWSQKSATLLGMTAPLTALAIPLLDAALAIVRRFLRGQPIFGADRGHVHHRLLDRGLTPRRAAILLYACCGLAAVVSLLQTVAQNQFGGLALVLFCATAWLGIQHLGYAEFGVAGRLLRRGAFREHLGAHVALRTLEDMIRSAETPEACWDAIRAGCITFGFDQAELCFAGFRRREIFDPRPRDRWILRIPLGADSDYLELHRAFASDAPSLVAPFARVVREVLLARRPSCGEAVLAAALPHTPEPHPASAHSGFSVKRLARSAFGE